MKTAILTDRQIINLLKIALKEYLDESIKIEKRLNGRFLSKRDIYKKYKQNDRVERAIAMSKPIRTGNAKNSKLVVDVEKFEEYYFKNQ